jgi:hypothetical protein
MSSGSRVPQRLPRKEIRRTWQLKFVYRSFEHSTQKNCAQPRSGGASLETSIRPKRDVPRKEESGFTQIDIFISSIGCPHAAKNPYYRCWRNLPDERDRLYSLIRDLPVVLLSGDRHVGGFYETEDGLIKEVTASAWTHSIPLDIMDGCDSAETYDEPDPRRIGKEDVW